MKKIHQVLVISFLFLVIFFDTAKAQCTIAVNSTTSGSAGISATSLTISHTVSGSNKILIVRASTKSSDPTSVTYNSTSLTKLATKNNGTQYVSLWYLINPSSGTNNVVVNGASGFTPIVGVTSYTGVNQSSAFGTVVNAIFSGSNPSLTVSSASGELVLDVINSTSSLTIVSGQTQQYNINEFVYYGSGSSKAGASSVTMSWTGFSPSGSCLAVPMKPCPAALVASAGIDKAICPGGSTSIGGSPTASGGTSPYTYSWSPTNGLGSTSTSANPTASPNNTKNYTVTVTDNAGVTATDAMVLTVGTPTADAGGNKNLCTGSSVALGGAPTASGGTSPYTYAWSPSTALSSTTAANPTSSATSTITYSVTVTDNNGCSSLSTVSVTVNPLPTASAGPNKTTCSGTAVAIGGSPTASGGTSPYTYAWSPTTALSSSTVANPNASPTSNTNYTVTVTDNNGCVKAASMSVTANPLPAVDAGLDKIICTGSSTSIGGAPTASGGTSPYTYAWSPSAGLNSTTTANPTANPTATTSYSVTVTDNNGCTYSDVAIVTVNPLPTADAGADASIYVGETTAIGGSPTASGGTSPYTYVWSPSTALSSATVSNPSATPASTTNYTVTITDNNGCTKDDALAVTVNPIPGPTTYTVTSTANGTTTDGVSLRWAITMANLAAGNTIAFNISGTAPHTITLTSALPVITKDNTTIDGCTQPANGYTGVSPKIIINGNNSISKGLELNSTKDYLTVYCLYIKGFTDNAIYAPGHENHIIGASGKGNVISGNGNAATDAAIYIKGGSIKGNIIGMNISGTAAEANTGSGIYANGGVAIIGGSASGEGNLISANTKHGIYLENADNSIIKGNKIGTNADGSIGFGNGVNGIRNISSSDDVIIGGSSAGASNLISGNTGDGIYNLDGNAIVIKGNKIGTNAAGTAAIANGGNGIYIANSANNVIIGDHSEGEGNLISGNTGNGISIVDGPNNATIRGNKIGTDVNGTQNLGNTGYGIFFSGNTTRLNKVGGSASGAANIIAYNGNSGVGVDAGGGTNTDDNEITRNSIFCNASAGNNLGIDLINNGNDGISKPVITSASATSISGTSEDDATIEIFKDDNCSGHQGKTYIGTTTANGSGNWNFTGVLSGNITATATKSGKGTSQFATSVLSVAEVAADAGADKTICSGASTGIGGAPTATGGTSPYTYVWTPSTGLNSDTIANPTASPTVITSYSVTVTDVNGLTANDVVVVTVNVTPTVTVSSNISVCAGSSANLTASGAATYVWSPTTGLSSSVGAAVTASPTSTTNYTVTGTASNGCTNGASVTVTVNLIPTAGITASNTSITHGESVELSAAPNGMGSYVWTPGNISGQNITVSPATTTVYTLTVTNSNGCTDNETVTISVETPVYASLKKTLDAGYYAAKLGHVYFKYLGEYSSGNLDFKVYDDKHIPKSCPGITTKQYGDNRFSIDLSACSIALNSGFYVLEVVNEKHEKFLLKFKY